MTGCPVTLCRTPATTSRRSWTNINRLNGLFLQAGGQLQAAEASQQKTTVYSTLQSSFRSALLPNDWNSASCSCFLHETTNKYIVFHPFQMDGVKNRWSIRLKRNTCKYLKYLTDAIQLSKVIIQYNN